MFDWYQRCACDGQQKRLFHRQAQIALHALAKELRLPQSSYDLRSNRAGVAVSGEIILHHDRVYIQVCQPATGADSGILIRTCEAGATMRAAGIISRPCRCWITPQSSRNMRAVMSGDLSAISRMFGPLAHKRFARG